jgi:SulP family sulfate permease
MLAAGVMAVLVGVFQLTMGLARLGVLVDFVSDSVVVGFTTGAGLLIFCNQIRNLLRLDIRTAPHLWETVPAIIGALPQTHWLSLGISLGTIVLIIVLRRINRRIPAPFVAMLVASTAVGLFHLDVEGVRVIGELPTGLPPLAHLPLLDLGLLGQLTSGALAIAIIGLVEAIAIARSIANRTEQRLDSNQEFVGQGMANIVSGLFSGYTCSGSFTRTAVNYEAGGKTSLASAFSGGIMLLTMLALAPLAAYVPLGALAGVLTITALRLIDRKEIARIWRGGKDDRLTLGITLVATLALPLQYAVLAGIAVSVGLYLLRIGRPRVRPVFMSDDYRYFVPHPAHPACTQLGVLEVLGDLFFGAVRHIEIQVRRNLDRNPRQRYLLLRMYAVENCDGSGIRALEGIVNGYRARGGDVFFVHVQRPVLRLMEEAGFVKWVGEDHFLDPDKPGYYRRLPLN